MQYFAAIGPLSARARVCRAPRWLSGIAPLVSARERHDRDSAVSPRTRHTVVRCGVAGLALLWACFLLWVVSGVPPAFMGGTVGWSLLAWLLISIACITFARPGSSQPVAAPTPIEADARWRLQVPPWLVISSALTWVALMVALSFEVSNAFPAIVLGPHPSQSYAQAVDFKEGKGRGGVDKTKVRFDTTKGLVEAWAADPMYTLETGSALVYDPDNPDRVMAQDAWAEARAHPWPLPVTALIWLMSLVAPFAYARARTGRYGSLRPGHPIRDVTRPKRAKLLTVNWDDGPRATFIDDPGLADALQRRIDTDGLSGLRVPGHSTPGSDTSSP